MRFDTTAFAYTICLVLSYSVGVIVGIVATRLERRASSDVPSKT